MQEKERGMQQVDIFLIISSRSPGKMRSAWYKYILICGRHRLEEKEDVRGHIRAQAPPDLRGGRTGKDAPAVADYDPHRQPLSGR